MKNAPPHRSLNCLAALLALGPLLAGCASSDAPERASVAEGDDRVATASTPLRDRATEGEAAKADAADDEGARPAGSASGGPRAAPAGPVFEPDAPAIAAADEPEADEPIVRDEAPEPEAVSAPRERVRPEWWIDRPHVDAGRLMVAAEALGEDVLTARRRVVDAARESLVRALGGASAREERIDYVTVRPLPRAVDAPGTARYIAFARISAAEPE